MEDEQHKKDLKFVLFLFIIAIIVFTILVFVNNNTNIIQNLII